MHRIALPILALIATAGLAQEPPNLISNGDFSDGTRGWAATATPPNRSSVVDAEADGLKKALRFEAKPEPGADPWALQVSRDVNGFINQGDRLQLKVRMRSPEGLRANAYVEIPRDPWTKLLSRVLELTPQWTEYTIEGESDADYSPGGLKVGFHLGFGAGTIEIADVRVHDLDLSQDQRERPTVDRPESVIENGDLSGDPEGNWGRGGGRLKVDVIDADAPGYRRAARLESDPEPGRPPWEVQWGQACAGYIHQGDAVYFRAWLRSPDECRVTFIWELGSPPHTKYIDQLARLTPEWQEYRFMGRAGQGFRPGESQAKFFLGHDAGVVEIAGVRVENYGDAPDGAFDQTIDYWAGREHPDTWREPALERIERIRKGDLTVRVVDGDGKPVRDCTVRVKQRRHHFRFGTALPAGRLVDTENPDNLRFQQEVERLFNTVTFENDLKWPSVSEGRLQLVEQAVEWLTERNIEARGHCLLWGSYRHIPSPAKELRGEELLEACRSHVTEYGTRMQGKLYLWDVVNEAGSNTEVWDEIGWESFADCFRWARAADPDVLLCYNDYGIVDERAGYREKVAERIRYLLDRDAPLDALGIQAHMHVPLTPIHRVLEILDEWAEFGKDLEITEFDLGCWDDEVHGQYIRDFMIAAFSHASVKAFIQWGFWEGSHWRSQAGGAMFRRDWSKRPAQEAYEDLVLGEWWTDWEGKTGEDGAASVRAFYGEHEVTAEAAGKRATSVTDVTPGEGGPVELRLE